MDIYALLSTKPNNEHYLKRYVRFIESCKSPETDYEKHHICPKSSDMFPEYKSFVRNPWNLKKLSSRQHFIAHWMLWKAYGGNQSVSFWMMCKGGKKDSSYYSTLRKRHSEIMRNHIRKLVELGEWHTQKKYYRELMSDFQLKRVHDGTHHWKSESHRKNRSVLMQKDTGLNPFQDKAFIAENAERSRLRALNKFSDGTHHFLTQEFKRGHSTRMTDRNRISHERECVFRMKSLLAQIGVKLGRGWNNRSTEWIETKILELESAHFDSIPVRRESLISCK